MANLRGDIRKLDEKLMLDHKIPNYLRDAQLSLRSDVQDLVLMPLVQDLEAKRDHYASIEVLFHIFTCLHIMYSKF